MTKNVLLLGSGRKRELLLRPVVEVADEVNIVTLDIDPDCKPDILWDLNAIGLPSEENSFDEIHAYEVLEHLGRQGDWHHFFREFSDYWRVLKPGGFLFGTCPSITSKWLWGDPGHTRTIQPETLTFLDQTEYTKQVGVTAFTDYRRVYKADFKPVLLTNEGDTFFFGLQAVKPSRIEIR